MTIWYFSALFFFFFSSLTKLTSEKDVENLENKSCESKTDEFYDVMFFEAFDEEQRIIKDLVQNDDFNFFYTDKTIQDHYRLGFDELENIIPNTAVISVRTQSWIPTSWGVHINAILTRSTGYDHLKDFQMRIGNNNNKVEREIKMCHLPDYSKRSVAEQAIILMGSLLRKLKRQLKSFPMFYRDKMTGSEIIGRNITVVGIGKIGGEVIDVAKGLKMNVVAVDVYENEELKERFDLIYKPLSEALEGCEVLISALPLTKDTNKYLNYEKLIKLKKGAIVINVGRGEVTPTKDLYRLLMEGFLSGVALDVYQYEKELASVLRGEIHVKEIVDDEARETVEVTLKMMEMDNVLFTPHNAFNTKEAVERKCGYTVDNYKSYRESGKFITPISF